jgi:hypothetical protein
VEFLLLVNHYQVKHHQQQQELIGIKIVLHHRIIIRSQQAKVGIKVAHHRIVHRIQALNIHVHMDKASTADHLTPVVHIHLTKLLLVTTVISGVVNLRILIMFLHHIQVQKVATLDTQHTITQALPPALALLTCPIPKKKNIKNINNTKSTKHTKKENVKNADLHKQATNLQITNKQIINQATWAIIVIVG